MGRKNGLSLLEVLVATVVLSALLLGATELVRTGQTAYCVSTRQAVVRSEAHRALDACVKELTGAPAFSPSPDVVFYRPLDLGPRDAHALLRTRVVEGCVRLERVVAHVDGPPTVTVLADLGPATLPPPAPRGGVTFEPGPLGLLRVKVSARTVVESHGERSVVPIELEDDVAVGFLAKR